MWPILLRFGDYELGTYGVLLGVAVLIGLWITRSLGERDGLDPKAVNDVGLLMMAVALVSAMLLGGLVAWLNGQAFAFSDLRSAGAVHGGLFGAMVAAYFLARRFRLPFFPLADAFVPAAAIGQAIGRIGCFLAGCCFGGHSEGPLAVRFTDPRAGELGGVPLHVALHPVQLYDAAAHFVMFFLLLTLHRREIFKHRLFGVWCVLEGITRFCIETFRGDLGRGIWFQLEWLSTGRLTALVMIAIGVTVLLKFPSLQAAAPAKARA